MLRRFRCAVTIQKILRPRCQPLGRQFRAGDGEILGLPPAALATPRGNIDNMSILGKI